MANTNSSLVEALKNGKASFSFTKVNGEKRTAVGTLNANVIRESGYVPAKVGNTIESEINSASGRNLYFDLEKKAWRTFTSDVTIL